jgi:hypothetical protein
LLNRELEEVFGVPVYDRYMVVIQIFREHAVSKEAKLQIAMAEIPYLRCVPILKLFIAFPFAICCLHSEIFNPNFLILFYVEKMILVLVFCISTKIHNTLLLS